MKRAYVVRIGMALAACALMVGEIGMVSNTWAATPAITIDDAVDEVRYHFHGIKRTHRTTSIPRPLNINVLEVTLAQLTIPRRGWN